ncbi:MAG: hypothetical protein K6A90_14235 [Lachnospiraceae bacterium]|nr:hypothetical protein [Lachnospiraceae bacterium]
MKQMQFVIKDEASFNEDLRKIRQWSDSNLYTKLLFHIYTERNDREVVDHICGQIKKIIPDAFYVGCSAYGSIYYGDFSKASILVSCTLFEYATTRMDIL